MNTSSKTLLIVLAVLFGGVMLTTQCPAPAPRVEQQVDGDKLGPRLDLPPAVDENDQQVADENGDGIPDKAQFGYRPEPEVTRQVLRSLGDKATLRGAAPDLFQAVGPPKPVLLYRALYKVYPGWQVGKQGIGDCVSWGWKHAADILLAIEYRLGQTSEWHPAATEAIYGGSRVQAHGGRPAGWSDGSSGGAAAKYVLNWGILYRQPYPGVDLSHYDSQLAKRWGNFGVPGELEKLARDHPIKGIALCPDFDSAATAISNGYPVPVCSGQGFSNTRDRDGFSAPSGSWSHCMALIGVRYEPRPGLLCLNSWGPNWIKGPKWPKDQPDGSFWVDAHVCTRMLSGRDSFAISAYKGFPPRVLDHTKGL